MDRYPLGNVIRLATEVRDDNGQLVDPTDLTLTIRRADLTVLTTRDYNPGPVVRDSVGVFHDDLLTGTGLGATVTAAGTYLYEWASTGITGLASGWFDVVAATPGLLTLAEARRALGKTSTVDDDELQLVVDGVNSWLDEEIGPVIPRAATATVTAHSGRLWLPGPAIALTSATRYGATVSTTGWTVAPDGMIDTGYYATAPTGTYVISYIAGYSPIPPELVIAARELAQHWWETQRGPSGSVRPGGAAFDDDLSAGPGLGFAVPNRVEEKIARYRQPAIA